MESVFHTDHFFKRYCKDHFSQCRVLVSRGPGRGPGRWLCVHSACSLGRPPPPGRASPGAAHTHSPARRPALEALVLISSLSHFILLTMDHHCVKKVDLSICSGDFSSDSWPSADGRNLPNRLGGPVRVEASPVGPRLRPTPPRRECLAQWLLAVGPFTRRFFPSVPPPRASRCGWLVILIR